jgi:beta-lactamase regulating signal transducer with metallopeptidase domain
LIAGIVVGVGIVGSLLVFAVFFVRRRKRQSNNDFEGKLEKENRASFLFKLSDLLTVCRIHI